MARDCRPDTNTSERLADVRAAERCMVPCWPLRQTALWTVKNSVFAWSRSPASREANGDALSELPLQVRQEVLDAMLRLKPDGREVMRAVKHLLKGGIHAFDLGCLDECHHYDVKQVILLLTLHGSIVRRITVRGQWLFDPENHQLLFDLLSSLSNAGHLCLQETSPGAPELDLVLRKCPRIQVLEISQPSLDDAEVEAFLDRSSTEVRRLKVPSSVRGRGLLALLRIFPNLEELECSHLDDLLESLELSPEHTRWRERTSRLLSVKTSHPIGRDSLHKLCTWCPNLNSVSVEIQEHVRLDPLTSLSNLKSLELKNSAVLPVSYADRVLNLVSAVGPRLTRLSLEHFDAVDLTQLSCLCRDLESLELRWFTSLTVSRVPKGLRPFSRLTSLCVRPRTNQHVKGLACELLLGSCIELQRLEMYCSHGLDDALLTRVLKTNPLRCLRVLLLRHGHGVTGKGLRQLVGRSSKIEQWDFGNFSPSK